MTFSDVDPVDDAAFLLEEAVVVTAELANEEYDIFRTLICEAAGDATETVVEMAAAWDVAAVDEELETVAAATAAFRDSSCAATAAFAAKNV